MPSQQMQNRLVGHTLRSISLRYFDITSLLILGALIAYAIFLAIHIGAYAAGSDSSGYMNNARLLADGQLLIERRMIDGLQEGLPSYAFVPLGFIPIGTHQMAPTYPMGLSLLVWGVSHLVGWKLAADVTLLLHALGSIAVLYGLAITCGLSRPLAFLATVLLGSSAIFIMQSLQAMSDVPALAWCSLAILLAWFARRDDRWALASGAAVAMSVIVRPTDMLVMVPVAIALGMSPRKWIWLLLGGLPGALFAAFINLTLYGKLLTTGYGDIGGLLSVKYTVPSLVAYAHWLPVMLTPAVVLIIAAPFVLRNQPHLLTFLFSWVLILLGFYSYYWFTSEKWTDMRFVLPAFASIILLMLLAYQEMFPRLPETLQWKRSIVLCMLALAWNGFFVSSFGVLHAGQREKIYPLAAEWAKANLPANSVIVAMQASGALLYYTNFTFVRWDQFTKGTFAEVEKRSVALGLPIYAILFPFEKSDVLERIPGRWDLVTTIDPVTIWRHGGQNQK